MQQCPRCGSAHLRHVTEYDTKTTSNTKGFGTCKGCLGFIFFGWIGWLCGLCGMGKGSSSTKTTSRNYWVCDNCGSKFQA